MQVLEGEEVMESDDETVGRWKMLTRFRNQAPRNQSSLCIPFIVQLGIQYPQIDTSSSRIYNSGSETSITSEAETWERVFLGESCPTSTSVLSLRPPLLRPNQYYSHHYSRHGNSPMPRALMERI